MLEVVKKRITQDNIGEFYIVEHRAGTKEFEDDCRVLKDKIVGHVFGTPNELTAKYPERYDITVLTYSQDKAPWLINDGCHRITVLRELFEKNLIDHFDAWLIPSNIIGATNKKEVLMLNAMVKRELDKAGLPHWVQKFDYEERDGKLIAWKNINLIDTGGEDKRLQYGVNWILNEDKIRDGGDVHNYKNKYKL